MRNSIVFLAVTTILVGCGGNDFSGVYVGDVAQLDTRTNATNTASEQWRIDDATLVRMRGTESCSLALETDTCSDGCYNKVLLVDQHCTFAAESFVLEMGEVSDGNVSDHAVTISLSWTSAAGVHAALVETGTLTKL